jgi:hypothetical protein
MKFKQYAKETRLDSMINISVPGITDNTKEERANEKNEIPVPEQPINYIE